MPHKDNKARLAYKQEWKKRKLEKLKADPEAYAKYREQESARVHALNSDPERKARNLAWAKKYREDNLQEVRARDRARSKEKTAAKRDPNRTVYNREEYKKAYYRANREKQLAAANAWNAANRERCNERARRNRLCRKWEGYYDLPEFATCDGCDKPLPDRKHAHADHCHDRNVFRGWLCRGCNHALGNVSDSPAVLRRLADYLEKHSAPPEDEFGL